MTFVYDKFETLAFYPYPTTVVYELAKFTELFNVKTGDRHVKLMFDKIVTDAEQKFNKQFMDNKIAFKVRHIPTGTILYVGYKDNCYRIGLSIYQESNKEIILKDEQ